MHVEMPGKGDGKGGEGRKERRGEGRGGKNNKNTLLRQFLPTPLLVCCAHYRPNMMLAILI